MLIRGLLLEGIQRGTELKSIGRSQDVPHQKSLRPEPNRLGGRDLDPTRRQGRKPRECAVQIASVNASFPEAPPDRGMAFDPCPPPDDKIRIFMQLGFSHRGISFPQKKRENRRRVPKLHRESPRSSRRASTAPAGTPGTPPIGKSSIAVAACGSLGGVRWATSSPTATRSTRATGRFRSRIINVSPA